MPKRTADRKRGAAGSRPTRWWIYGGVGLLLLALAVAVGARALARPAAPAAAGAEGAAGRPRIAFDETSHDFGRVPYDREVRHEFRYRNVGDAPLTIGAPPTIVAVEGC